MLRRWFNGLLLSVFFAAVFAVSSLYALPVWIVVELLGYEANDLMLGGAAALIFGPYLVATHGIRLAIELGMLKRSDVPTKGVN